MHEVRRRVLVGRLLHAPRGAPLELRDLLVGVERAIAELGPALDRRDRAVVPDALQIGIAPGRARDRIRVRCRSGSRGCLRQGGGRGETCRREQNHRKCHDSRSHCSPKYVGRCGLDRSTGRGRTRNATEAPFGSPTVENELHFAGKVELNSQWSLTAAVFRNERSSFRARRPPARAVQYSSRELPVATGARGSTCQSVESVSVGAVVLAAPAWAHHGFGRFDPTKDVTIEGTLTGIDFVNPHAYLYFDAAGGGR